MQADAPSSPTPTIGYETRDDMSVSPRSPGYPPPGYPALGSYLRRAERRRTRVSLPDIFPLQPGEYPLEGLEPGPEARRDFSLNGQAGASPYPEDPFHVDTMDMEDGNGEAGPAGPSLRRSGRERRPPTWIFPTQTNIRSQASSGYNEYFVIPEA